MSWERSTLSVSVIHVCDCYSLTPYVVVGEHVGGVALF